MNVPASPTVRISAEPVTRAGWSCPGCGTNYSPDVKSCSCTCRQAPVITVTYSGVNEVPRQVAAELSRAVRASASRVRLS